MSQFLDLPAEIRDLIYRYCSENETGLSLCIEEDKKQTPILRQQQAISFQLKKVSLFRALLQTCKLCYKEAINLYQSSLTHLVVDFAILQEGCIVNKGFNYGLYFQNALTGIDYDTKGTRLLERTQKLTIPPTIPRVTLIQVLESQLLPALKIVEYCAIEEEIGDSFSHDMPDLVEGTKPEISQHEKYMQNHMVRTGLPAFLHPRCYTAIAKLLPKQDLQILWTAEAKLEIACKFWWDKPNQDDDDICTVVDYTYTYDCCDEKMTSIHIASIFRDTGCGYCAGCLEGTLTRYFGADTMALLDARSRKLLV